MTDKNISNARHLVNYSKQLSSVKERKIQRNAQIRHNYAFDVNSVSKVLSLFLLALLIIALIRICLGAEPIYFSSFLDTLVNAPVVNFTLPIDFAGLSGQDWGVFNILKSLLDFLSQIVSIGSFILNGLVNLLMYLFYFVRIIFGY